MKPHFPTAAITGLLLATLLAACNAPVSASYRGIRPGMPCDEAIAEELALGSRLLDWGPANGPGEEGIEGDAYDLSGKVEAHESGIRIVCDHPPLVWIGKPTVWSLLTTTAFDSEADAAAFYERQVAALTRPDDKPEIEERRATPAQAARTELLDPQSPVWRSARWDCDNAQAPKGHYFKAVGIYYPRRASPKFRVETYVSKAGPCI